MELVRWRPSSPLGEIHRLLDVMILSYENDLGIPHATTVDDVYEDYFIPKGPCV